MICELCCGKLIVITLNNKPGHQNTNSGHQNTKSGHQNTKSGQVALSEVNTIRHTPPATGKSKLNVKPWMIVGKGSLFWKWYIIKTLFCKPYIHTKTYFFQNFTPSHCLSVEFVSEDKSNYLLWDWDICPSSIVSAEIELSYNIDYINIILNIINLLILHWYVKRDQRKIAFKNLHLLWRLRK